MEESNWDLENEDILSELESSLRRYSGDVGVLIYVSR